MLIKSSKDFGRLIHEARKNAELTQAELAAACGLGERFIRELEKGKPTCQIEKALLVALMVGVSINAKMPPQMGSK